MNKLVISLVTYNGAPYMRSCLESIEAQTFTDYELIVGDNASSDTTVDLIRQFYPNTQCMLKEENTGFAAGHNSIVQSSHSEYVCVLNQDCVLDSNYLQECVGYLDSHPDVASVTGLLIRVPSLTDKGPCDTVDAYGLHMTAWAHVKNYRENTPVKDIHESEEVVGVPATAAVYRRAALDDIVDQQGDFFDEDFFMYKEDVDLALRLRLRGWRAYALNTTRGYHIRTTHPALFSRPSQRINEWSYRNQFYILIKDITTKQWIRNGVLISTYEVIKFFYLLLFETSTLKVLANVWHNRKKMFAKRAIIMKRKSALGSLTPNP